MRTRYIPENSVEIKDDKCNAVCYLTAYDTGRYSVIGYSGRRNKSDFAYSYKDLDAAEAKIEEHFANIQAHIDRKNEYKEQKKAQLKELKATITAGNYLRTSFSYNMTFNYFYKVLEKKGNKVTVQKLEARWVSGDIGYTGEVSPTDDVVGEPFTVNFSANGLKIEDHLASVCSLNDHFYQNHMD